MTMQKTRKLTRGMRLSALLAFATAFALILTQTGALARLQATLDSPSPASGSASVIAQGIAPMPADPIAWRVVSDVAEPLGTAQAVERALGFVMTSDGALQIDDTTHGIRERLAPGEASFVSEGAVQLRASLTDANVPYYRIALVAEADANDPGVDELLFGGTPFPAPDGTRDIDLVRGVLGTGESTTIAGGDFPVLVIATSGSIEIDAGGAPVTLNQGEAGDFSGDLTITGTSDSSTFVAGVIGPDVPVPPRTSGTVSAGVYACPEGVTVEDLSDADVVASCEAVADGADLKLAGADGSEFTLEGAEEVGSGIFSWSGLAFGDYELSLNTLPEGYASAQFFDRDGNTLDSGNVSIDADFPDAHIDIYLFQEAVASGSGSITATVYTCPEGWDPQTGSTAECSLATSGFDISISAGNTGVVRTLADAEASGGSFVWYGLPLSVDEETFGDGYYIIEQAPLPAGYNTYYAAGASIPDGPGGFDYVNLTPGTPDVSLEIYNYSTAAPKGTITLDTIVCPTGEVNPESCTREFGPDGLTGIFIQDMDGALNPLTIDNAIKEGDGPYVWIDVDYAVYMIDTPSLVAPAGYQIVQVMLTDGTDISSGFTINQDVPIANVLVVLVPAGGDDTTPVSSADEDADGLSDTDETTVGTDPANPDSDADCHGDGNELTAGTDPLNAASFPDTGCDLVEE